MTALTSGRSLYQVASGAVSAVQIGAYTGAKLYQGGMVAALTASGMGVPAGTASTGPVLGVAEATADNSAGSSGDVSCNILQGAFWFDNHSVHTVTEAYVGKPVYASDDQTVSTTSSDGPLAGICLGVSSDTGVLVYIGANLLAQGTMLASLASVANANGASLVGVEDAGTFTANATVEACLAEIYQHLKSSKGRAHANLASAILAAGTPMAAWTDNAGASAPGITLANSKAVGLRWNNYATQTAVYLSCAVPADLDTSVAASVKVIASKTGATVGDATTFDIGLYNNVNAALHDADTNYGGTTSAMTATATAKTEQTVSLAIAAADLPTADGTITLSIKPTDGTLGTDDLIVHSICIEYKRKLLTS